jgi:hypothetical protein
MPQFDLAMISMLAVLAAAAPTSALADSRTDAERRLFMERFPEARVENVKKAPVAGL